MITVGVTQKVSKFIMPLKSDYNQYHCQYEWIAQKFHKKGIQLTHFKRKLLCMEGLNEVKIPINSEYTKLFRHWVFLLTDLSDLFDQVLAISPEPGWRFQIGKCQRSQRHLSMTARQHVKIPISAGYISFTPFIIFWVILGPFGSCWDILSQFGPFYGICLTNGCYSRSLELILGCFRQFVKFCDHFWQLRLSFKEAL